MKHSGLMILGFYNKILLGMIFIIILVFTCTWSLRFSCNLRLCPPTGYAYYTKAVKHCPTQPIQSGPSRARVTSCTPRMPVHQTLSRGWSSWSGPCRRSTCPGRTGLSSLGSTVETRSSCWSRSYTWWEGYHLSIFAHSLFLSLHSPVIFNYYDFDAPCFQ